MFRHRPWKFSAFCVLTAGSVLAGCTTTVNKVEATCNSGQICTYAGTGASGYNGESKDRRESYLSYPADITFDGAGHAFIVDFNNYRIRRVNADDTLESIIGDGFPGDGDAAQADKTDKGAKGVDVRLNHPADLFFAQVDSALAKKGEAVLTAWHNHRLRVWDPATGTVFAHCGANPGYAGDGAAVTAKTQFNQPSHAVQDKAGNTYVIDSRNWAIRKIAVDGTISTVAGQKPKSGAQTWPGFDPLSDAGAVPVYPTTGGGSPFLFFDLIEFSNPTVPGGGLAVSDDGNTLYVADTGNNRIRAIDLKAGTVSTIAGSGASGCVDLAKTATNCQQDVTSAAPGGFSGDGGQAKAAQLNRPHDLAISPIDGRLYFADTDNNRIRAIDLKTGIITTIAGSGEGNITDKAGEIGDGGDPLKARLAGPIGLSFDAVGNLYIADMYHSRIRIIPK